MIGQEFSSPGTLDKLCLVSRQYGLVFFVAFIRGGKKSRKKTKPDALLAFT